MDYPFRTDGCSVVLDFDQGRCCVKHDWKYWKGGTWRERLKADQDFRECVLKTQFAPWLAWIRYYGVRVGGVSWLPFRKWRWGYGWRFPRWKAPSFEHTETGIYTEKNQKLNYMKALAAVRGTA